MMWFFSRVKASCSLVHLTQQEILPFPVSLVLKPSLGSMHRMKEKRPHSDIVTVSMSTCTTYSVCDCIQNTQLLCFSVSLSAKCE